MYYFYREQSDVFEDEQESRFFEIDLVYKNIFSDIFQEKYKMDIEFTKNALKGLKDKSGEPLYLHALRMASALDIIGYSENYILVALFHDILEDSKDFPMEYLKDRLGNNYKSLEQLTRDKNMTYRDYILHIEDDIALKVKEMDINDHLYNREYISDSLIKRYEKAMSILESTSKHFEKKYERVDNE